MLQPINWGRRQICKLFAVWKLVPITIQYQDAWWPSKCRQEMASASDDTALEMWTSAFSCHGWMGQCGQHYSKQKQELSLPHLSFRRESPSHAKSIPKPGPIIHLGEKHLVFPVLWTCLEPPLTVWITSSGLISALFKLEKDKGTFEAEC